MACLFNKILSILACFGQNQLNRTVQDELPLASFYFTSVEPKPQNTCYMKKKCAAICSLSYVLLMLLGSFQLIAQTPVKKITGKVLNETQKPLVGAVVQTSDGKIKAISTEDGSFAISVPSASTTVVVSYVGHLEQVVPLNGLTVISVVMKVDDKGLDEVVVVGYGTRKKSDVTGAVASINSKVLQAIPTTNLSQALQGRIAGVESTPTSFKPGTGSKIRVRGNRSFNATNDPLYVVDGMPVSYTIDDINPMDIETVDVLKDASATAIYGVRGANGVIQITTKKGKAGKFSVDYSGSVSFENILKNIPVFNAPQLADSWRQAFSADKVYNYAQATSSPNLYFPDAQADVKLFGGTTGNAMWEFIKDAYQFTTFDRLTNTYIAKKRATTAEEKALLANLKFAVLDSVSEYDPTKVRGYDWQGNAVRQGITQNHNLSIAGGSDKLKSNLSVGYFNQKGIEFGQDYKRYSVSNSNEFKPTSYLTFGTNISYTNSTQNVGPNMYANASGMLPFTKPYDSLGNFLLYPNGDQQIINAGNDVNTVFNEVKVDRIIGNIFAEVNLLKGLKFRSSFGIDTRNTRNGVFNGSLSSVRQGTLANASHTISNSQSWIFSNLLSYNFKVKSDHNFNVGLLQEMQSLNKTDVMSMAAQNLIFEEQKWYSLNRNTLATVTGSGSYTAQQLVSFMGRLEYAYKNKYLFTFSNRYDNSSVLSEGNQGAFFPSAAFAWRVDNEKFFSEQNIFSSAKVRVGIGRVGNSSIAPYQTNGPLDFTLYNWGNGTAAIGSAPTTFKTPNLSWEKTTTQNLGFEFGMLKGRINATLDFYQSSTTDELQRVSIPATNGVTFMYINLGEIKNKGFEFSLNTVNINSKSGFRWTTDFVFSRNKESIVNIDGTGNNNLANLLFIGQPLRVYYSYQAQGMYQFSDTAKGGYLKDYLWTKGTNAANTAYRAGKINVRDANGDTLIDGNDKMILGTDNPDWTGSITNTLSYKNFDLNFMIYFRGGGMYRAPRPGLVGRYQSNSVNYWTPTNPSNEYQQPTRTSDVPTYWEALTYRSGSFARVRNISLTYHLPQSVLKKLKANAMSVYINSLNPFLFHTQSDYDPETIQYTEQFAATTGNPGPNSYSFRSFVVGVRIGL